MDENKSEIELKSRASEEVEPEKMAFLNKAENEPSEGFTEDDEEDEEDDEYEDWDTSCLEDWELEFDGMGEERLKEILFLAYQALIYLRPELKGVPLEVEFYAGMETQEAESDPSLCEDYSTEIVVQLLGDLLNALIISANPVGWTYEYNDGPHDHPDGYSPYASRIEYRLENLGDVTAREILVSPGRLFSELQKENIDLKQFVLGKELLAKGVILGNPAP